MWIRDFILQDVPEPVSCLNSKIEEMVPCVTRREDEVEYKNEKQELLNTNIKRHDFYAINFCVIQLYTTGSQLKAKCQLSWRILKYFTWNLLTSSQKQSFEKNPNQALSERFSYKLSYKLFVASG